MDPGTRRIGIALSDPLGVALRPLPPLAVRSGMGRAAGELALLAAEHGAETVVIGLPRRTDGSEGQPAKEARALAAELRAIRPGLRVLMWDERLTTVIAEKTLLEADLSRRRRRQLIDGQAAMILLEDYLRAQVLAGAQAGLAEKE